MATRAPQWPQATLLGRIRPELRDELVAMGVGRTYPARHRIIHQWDETQYAFLLLAGIVKVIGSTQPGSEALLDIRVGGDLVGEMAALDGEPRSASVVTCGAVQARLIKQADLNAFMARHPSVTVELTKILSQRLRWANRRRLDFLAHDAATRVARVLCEIAATYGRPDREGWDLGLDLTQVEVASIAGVALATAEKALHQLEADGLIRRGYRRIAITDLDQMRAASALADPP